ncbi:Tyrosine-protein kinase, catalytic domain [Sesbania bispinosa]|nr:Tyrosine-protein kinase, catalytic domain [Sesbania bispinosa]
MDLNYVLRIPWNSSACENFHSLASKKEANTTTCCITLLSLFGIGLAQHLKETSRFQLPNLPTSNSCLEDFQSKLTSLSLPNNIVNSCFDPLQFVISPNICAGIETIPDWTNKLGQSTPLNTACRADLTDLSLCDVCLAAGLQVKQKLVSIDGNASHSLDCFYFAILYAAGIVNEFGPESNGAVTCIFSLPVHSQVGSGSKGHQALVFGLTGAGVALLVMSSLLALYVWYDRKRKKRKLESFQFDFDPEEQGSRRRLRPNTGSIWFKIGELEKATDNFSPKNFIGRGGFGLVFKGTLPDGTVVAVKRILDSDFQGDVEFCNEVEIISNLKHRNLVPLRGCCVEDERSPRAFLITDWAWSLVKSGKIEEALDASLLKDENCPSSNPKSIMERFLLVGILCSHVMVALRPTIADALKMLEGDIEVPQIPDRPMPLGHPSFYNNTDGNTFSISPALSGPKLQTGDMLRSTLHLRPTMSLNISRLKLAMTINLIVPEEILCSVVMPTLKKLSS